MLSVSNAGAALVETFAHIRIINLKSRADRRREMAQQLGRLGLSYDHPQIHLHEASRFGGAGAYPSIGARGCFHSHLKILKQAATANLRSVLIIEDDLDFARNAETLVPTALEALQGTEWSVFYGGYVRTNAGQDTPRHPIFRIESTEPIQTTHFIALRGEAIAAAAAYLDAIDARPPGSPEGGPMHVDGAYSWFRRAHPDLETWLAMPELGYQRPSRTDIHDLGWKDRWRGIREITAFARRIVRKR